MKLKRSSLSSSTVNSFEQHNWSGLPAVSLLSVLCILLTVNVLSQGKGAELRTLLMASALRCSATLAAASIAAASLHHTSTSHQERNFLPAIPPSPAIGSLGAGLVGSFRETGGEGGWLNKQPLRIAERFAMTMDAVRAGSPSRMVRADAATAEVRESVFSVPECKESR